MPANPNLPVAPVTGARASSPQTSNRKFGMPAMSGAGCHVGGEDVVGVAVEVVAGPVVSHGVAVLRWRSVAGVMPADVRFQMQTASASNATRSLSWPGSSVAIS
jgi:hypothetical protein